MTVLTQSLAQALVQEQGKDVVIPDVYTSIDDKAFSGNQLTTVEIPDGVTTIGDDAFSRNQLTTIKIPASVTTIGFRAFWDNQLTTVEIPDGVTTIGDSAFSSNQLKTIKIPDSVITLGGGAFSGNNLTSVDISKNITAIKSYTFQNNQLTHVDIPDGVTGIGLRSFHGNKLVSINLPDSITTIGTEAFLNNQLSFVRFPDSYVFISTDAFAQNPLEKISLPIQDSIRGISLPGVEIIIRNDNTQPSNISISRTAFNEIIPAASLIGTLGTTDFNTEDTYTYSLVSGTGDTDNNAFRIDGDQLLIVDSPDFETKSSYSIRLQTIDSGGLTFERSLDLTVNEWVTDQLITTTETNVFPKFENSYLSLATSPGGSISLDTAQDFSFANYTYITDRGHEAYRNPVKNAFYVSENSALLQYQFSDDDEVVSNDGEVVYAIKNNAGSFQKLFTYEATPNISGYYPHGIVAFTFDKNDNLYSIRRDSNYDSINFSDRNIYRLIAHDSAGKLLWSQRLNYGGSFDLEYDNNQGLLVTRINSNEGISYYHYSAITGLQNWTANPYKEFSWGGFGTSQRSTQILDDGTFLASSSGYLNIAEDLFSGTFLAKISLQDGSLESLLPVDSDTSYWGHELFENSGSIYLRTGQGAHKINTNAEPLKQVYPIILPTSEPEPAPEPTPEPAPEPAPEPIPTQEETIGKVDSIKDITTSDEITIFKLTKPISVAVEEIKTLIIGTERKDRITGSSEGEVLWSGVGKDVLKGGGGPDGFLFRDPEGFGKKEVDKIIDFDPNEGDSIFIDKEVFGLGKKIKLKIVSSKKKLKKSTKSKKDFIYDERKGLLYFNENGKQKGWGEGGLFAKLQGAPELGASDFTIV